MALAAAPLWKDCILFTVASLGTGADNQLAITRRSAAGFIMPNTISNTPESERAIYVRLGPRLKVEQDLSLLVQDPAENLDFTNVFEDLLGRAVHPGPTIWSNVVCIPPGYAFDISKSAVNSSGRGIDLIRSSVCPLVKNADIMQVLESTIARVVKSRHAEPYIALSGGRDSTSIAHVMNKLKIDACAVTWTFSRGGSHDDAMSASEITRTLGLKHEIYEIDPRLIFSEPIGNALRPRISTSTAFFETIRSLIFRCQRRAGRKVMVFNGHGGDHLYLDPLPPEILLDSLRSLKLLQAWERMATLREVYGCGTTQLLLRTIAVKKYENKLASQLLGINAFKLKPRRAARGPTTAKQLHLNRIDQAIFDNTTSEQELATNMYYPFTTREVVDCVRDIPCERLFNRSQQRVPFIESFVQYAGASCQLRTNKGDVTGVFQRAISEKFDWLRTLISNGVLAKNKKLNSTEVFRLMEKNSHGFGGVEPILMKIISFELMMLK